MTAEYFYKLTQMCPGIIFDIEDQLADIIPHRIIKPDDEEALKSWGFLVINMNGVVTASYVDYFTGDPIYREVGESMDSVMYGLIEWGVRTYGYSEYFNIK